MSDHPPENGTPMEKRLGRLYMCKALKYCRGWGRNGNGMLILARKLNEQIVIDGRILVKVLRIDGDTVKLGIEAPPDVPVHRQEVYDEIQRGGRDRRLSARLPSTPPPAPATPSPETSA